MLGARPCAQGHMGNGSLAAETKATPPISKVIALLITSVHLAPPSSEEQL